MKATITAKGDLFVIAETETESYALSCWWNAYQGNSTEASRPAFGVRMFEPSNAIEAVES